MGRRSRSDWTCGGLTLLQKINNALREHFTGLQNPAPREVPALVHEEGEALFARESLEREDEDAAVPPTQFHRFPDLPAELRLQIWEEATRHKRYVVVDPPCNNLFACIRLLRDFRRYSDRRFTGKRRPLWTSPTPPPAMLSVSCEARQVALKYINFDQDDIVIRSGALANHTYFGVGGPIDIILRPWDEWVAGWMIGAWLHTDDVEKIQRVVACGNFMKGIRDYAEAAKDFMMGLKSLTMIRIGNLRPCSCSHGGCSTCGRKIYTRASRSGKGAPLLSLAGIDFAKTANTFQCASTKSFAELEVIDFDGGSASKDVANCWKTGPETLGWQQIWSGLSKAVHLGPGKRCVRSSRWYCQTRDKTNIWYAI